MLLESLGADATPWTQKQWRVLDFVPTTAQVRLRFIAEDAGGGSIVEAAVDDVEIYDNVATAAPAGAPPARAVVQLPNVPNPFNPATTLPFRLNRAGRVRVDVYDLRGRRTRRLFDAELPAGEHQVRWDGRDEAGRTAASGTYLAVVTSGGARSTRKITLAK